MLTLTVTPGLRVAVTSVPTDFWYDRSERRCPHQLEHFKNGKGLSGNDKIPRSPDA
jgi:hypothetical protein